jgi:hypothetical protein
LYGGNILQFRMHGALELFHHTCKHVSLFFLSVSRYIANKHNKYFWLHHLFLPARQLLYCEC